MVKKSIMDDDENIDKIVRRINAEVSGIPMSHKYDLADFKYHKTVQDTSQNPLKLMSKLVWGRDHQKVSFNIPMHPITWRNR